MSMSVGSGSKSSDPDVMSEMNMTPLIDVMLVLIIMMIMTIPIQNHSVSLNMPVGTPPPPKVEPIVVTINVDFDGTVVWDGVVVPNRAEWEAKLKAIAAKDPQDEVHLGPHKMVEYKYVAAVLASAQRLGVTNIGLVGNEQFVN